MDSKAVRVVAAIRSAEALPRDEREPDDVLVESAEDLVFSRRALVPPEVVAARALANHLEATSADVPVEAIHNDWLSALTVVIDRFEMDPSDALSGDCEEFKAGCGRVFGIDDEACHIVLREFHSMELADRVGVYLAIEESESFGFLQRLIDAAPEDTEFTNPQNALRALLRATLARL